MIYLLRHGQTEFNLQGRYQGWSDSPLTAEGRRQALACGKLLERHDKPRMLWVSPLPRARETARLIAQVIPGISIREDDRLREVSLGEWEGKTRAEIAVESPSLRKLHPGGRWVFHAPAGESQEAVLGRIGSVLADAAREPTVALVSHGLVGRMMRGLHAGLPLTEALRLEAPQDAIFRLLPDGRIDRLSVREAEPPPGELPVLPLEEDAGTLPSLFDRPKDLGQLRATGQATGHEGAVENRERSASQGEGKG
ncbi:histidine phosphatase family protein [Paracoccus sp. MBLB3053]|uniref:Histidine phosphatase family protein n=1 Tax=Paracoccus aurantius TaxID=3073814 RepID=A0ABU2HYF5_9RHOB|nr:histidine phosphatase family protein [Paracoccus sp. MBLB3053]MDS9470093.1 histidine phosphatase family protein [Paracoccus sp. MBLB3053]